MNTSEFIKEIKKNFEVLPTKQEVKNFMWKNNIDINKSTDEISLMLVSSYKSINYSIPKKDRKDKNHKKITKEEIEELLNMGLMHDQVAKRLDISTCKLSQLKSKYDLITKYKRLNKAELTEYMKSHTQSEAAEYFHKNQSEISRQMKEYEIRGKRNFTILWQELKKKVDKKTLKLMNELEG